MLIVLMDAFWGLCFLAALGSLSARLDTTGGRHGRSTLLGLSVATATVAFGLVAWLTPSILSLWDGLTVPAVSTAWLLACAAVTGLRGRHIVSGWSYATSAMKELAAWLRSGAGAEATISDDQPSASRQRRTLTLAWVATVAGLVLLTAASALLYPPTVWDSFSHHLPRIVQFIQNQTVAPFPTYYPSMNATYPFTAYLNTQAALLWGSTNILNLTQWFAYVVSAVLVYVITRELGGSVIAARIATLIGMTAPSVALQASSTQYDLVTAMWCLIAVLLVLSLRADADSKQPSGGGNRSQLQLVVLLGIALGLGAVAKITFIVLAAPFCAWLLAAYLRRAGVRKAAASASVALVIALVVATPWLSQNIALGAGALGADSPGNNFMLVQDRTPGALWTNAVRNLTMQLSTPVAGVNRAIAGVAGTVAAPLGVPIDSPTNKEDFDRPFELPTWTFNPDMASSPATALLIAIAVVAVAISSLRSSRPERSTALIYASCGMAGTLIIAAFVTWNPFITRSLGTAILVLSPVAGIGLALLGQQVPASGRMRVWPALTGLLVLGATGFCLLAVVFNASAPLVSRSVMFGGDWNGYWDLPYLERGWGVELPFLRPDIEAVRTIASSTQGQPAEARGADSDSLPPIALIGGEAGDHMPAYPLIVELQKAGYAVVYEDRFGPIPLRGVIGSASGYESALPELVLSYDFEGSAGTAVFSGAPIGSSMVYELSSQRVTTYELAYQRLTPELGTVLSIYRATTSGEAVNP